MRSTTVMIRWTPPHSDGELMIEEIGGEVMAVGIVGELDVRRSTACKFDGRRSCMIFQERIECLESNLCMVLPRRASSCSGTARVAHARYPSR